MVATKPLWELACKRIFLAPRVRSLAGKLPQRVCMEPPGSNGAGLYSGQNNKAGLRTRRKRDH